MPHVIFRNNIAYYSRRVPRALKKYDSREKVKLSLHTDSPSEAEKRSSVINEKLEAYWNQLITTGDSHDQDNFAHITEMVRLFGFTYRPSHELAEASSVRLVNRLQAVSQVTEPMQVEALLGGVPVPELTLTDALNKYWGLAKGELLDKSESQIRKWKNPRKKAINNAISVLGGKRVSEITRDDIIQFRDWWIDRLGQENLQSNSANKDLTYLKVVISTVSDHSRLGLDVDWLFRRIMLKASVRSERLPFENEFIQNQLLDLTNHTEMNEEARYFLYAMADTGARPSELIGLLPEEIVLNAPVPYIRIQPRKGHSLKTPHSKREIPLVGCALYAFEKLPNGFEHYRGMKGGADSLSANLMKHLKSKKLLPTEDHTVYSLRHSFQDNLTAIGVPDRVQAQLMGHKFDRPEYGKGADLELKRDWLQKICFAVPATK